MVVADDVRDVHAFAALLGYGADAICPRLALATVAAEADTADDGDLTSPEAQGRFQAAVEAGVLKILSKMGICTVDSYRGAQIFEVVGLGPEVVDVCFTGTPNVVGGIGWERARRGRPRAATPRPGASRSTSSRPASTGCARAASPTARTRTPTQALNDLALVQETVDDGQDRDMLVAHLLQSAIRSESSERYDAFAKLANDRPPIELHDLLELVPGRRPGRRSTRSSRPPTSPGGSRPAPCRTAPCRRRRTRRSPRP